ncbi:MAG: hypothetical protein AB8G05_10260 [Oligoflexales bacterium]
MPYRFSELADKLIEKADLITPKIRDFEHDLASSKFPIKGEVLIATDQQLNFEELRHFRQILPPGFRPFAEEYLAWNVLNKKSRLLFIRRLFYFDERGEQFSLCHGDLCPDGVVFQRPLVDMAIHDRFRGFQKLKDLEGHLREESISLLDL